MGNWKNLDGRWINFDNMSRVSVKYDPQEKKYEIHACEIHEANSFRLISKQFTEKQKASDFLDAIMNTL